MEDYNTLTGIPTATQSDASALFIPIFVGWQLQLMLYGLALSMWWRWEDFHLESKRMKWALGLVFALLTICSLLSMEEMVYFAIWQRRTYEEVIRAHLPSAFEPLVTSSVAIIVQAMLTMRAASFFPKDWRRTVFLAVNGALGLLGLFGALGVTVLGFLYAYDRADDALPLTYSNCTGIWLGSTAAVDLSISFGLWYTLRVRLQRSQSFIANSLLRSFLVTTLQTAAYTAFFAAGGLAFAILAIVKEQNAATFDLPFVFWLPMPSLYALSLFTTLTSNTTVNRHLRQGEKSTL